MNTHYIPRLLLKQFANNEKRTNVHCYNYETKSFSSKNTKNIFTEDDLFPADLEQQFAYQLESPFASLLNNKVLRKEKITINRPENMLLRKFFLIQTLRHPMYNGSWEEMLERTKSKENPTMQMKEVLSQLDPQMKEMFQQMEFTQDDYLPNLIQGLNAELIEDLAKGGEHTTLTLTYYARLACVAAIAFWDCKDSGQEFILPKLTGISLMDDVSILYKWTVLRQLKASAQHLHPLQKMELERLEHGSTVFFNNFTVYPLSPTRLMVCFSPYFRGFFPQQRYDHPATPFPPLLGKEQFPLHFFKPLPFTLFEPCKNHQNTEYHYQVKSLSAQEVFHINAMLLNVETEEFVFHDFHKIKDSFWHYENVEKIQNKQHDFSNII